MKTSHLVSNWLAGLLLVVATICIVGQIVWDKVKGQTKDVSLTLGMSLCLGICWLAFAMRFTQAEWLLVALLLVQFILLVIALKKIWPALKKLTRN